MIRRRTFSAAALAAVALPARAMCPFDNTQQVKILAPSFAAWRAVTAAMQECANVQVELDLQYKEKQPAALAARPALYQVAGVAINSLVPLLDDNTVRPLDDFISRHGQQLEPIQLIRINNRVMAIAMMINIQHLMYRRDIFQELGIAPPTSYDQVLAACEAIKRSGKVAYPLGGTYKTGWDLATEFVNLFFGFGGRFFAPNNTPTLNAEPGRRTLEMMRALTAFMDPEYLTSDATFVQQQFQRGRIALANLWSSRAAAVDDPKESMASGKIAVAAAPAAAAGGKPATTVWWDGFAIAANTPEAQAEAAFRVALHGIGEEMVRANNDLAVWLIRGYRPGPLAEGAIASAKAGAPTYPATTAMGLMQTALGNNLANFFTGREDAGRTLGRVEAAYVAAARERGLLR